MTTLFIQHAEQTKQALKAIAGQSEAGLSSNGNQYYAPTSIHDLSQHLLANPQAKLLAGGTDLALAVTQQLDTLDHLVYVGDVVEIKQISETDNDITIGAAVPYSEFTPLLSKHYPELGEMIERIGSTQIRNVGTLGGNIGNASPIGDMPPALIALGATMTLRKGDSERTIKVEQFFKDYKVTDLAESEFISSVTIPKPSEGQHFKVYKISKRIDDDISAVLAAMSIEIEEGKVKTFSTGFGGMAAIPKRAAQCEQALIGQSWNQATLDNAKQALGQDFNPMSDVRATDKYRMKVSQNLLQKAFIEINNRTIETRVVNHA